MTKLAILIVEPEASVAGATAAGGRPSGAYLVGDSPSMQQLKAYIGKVAAADSNVLITGETGTGKELVAELIQQTSPRWPRPFVCINCAAIPDMLLESELFGYEKGAFTGANTASEGKLKLADGGAIFFDEIGDMSPHAQAKILRAIESREVYRLGGKRRIPVNVRVLAATNHDLEQEVRIEVLMSQENKPMPIMLRITSFSLSEGRRVRAVRMVARSGFPLPDPVPLGEGGKRRSGHDTRTRFLRK